MKRTFTFTALSLALAGGCAKTVNSVEINQSGQYQWIKTDPDLGGSATVVRVNKVRTGDVLHVQVELQNNNSNEAEFIYRWIWLDGNGMVVPTPLTNWQRQHILGKQKLQLAGVAPDPRITDVRLEMKRPED